MSAVSPVLRTSRWLALTCGIFYGARRVEELRPIRAAERAREAGEFFQFLIDFLKAISDSLNLIFALESTPKMCPTHLRYIELV